MHRCIVLFVFGVAFCHGSPVDNHLVAQKKELDNALKNSTSFCATCNITVALANGLFQQPLVDTFTIEAMLIEVCVQFKIQGGDPTVCKGYIRTHLDVWKYVYFNKYGQPDHLCYYLNVLRFTTEKCGAPIDGSEWHISIQNGTQPVEARNPDASTPTMRIVHMTDIHWDHQYLNGSEVDCGLPLCCRTAPINGAAIKRPAGYWGTVGSCDVPKRTVVKFLEHLNTIRDTFDMIYWTGDLPPHDVWDQTMDGNIDLDVTLIDLVHTYLPDVPIYPAMGNHDAGPVDNFPPITWFKSGYINDPTGTLEKTFSVANLYNNMSSKWPELTNSTTHSDTIKAKGSYSIYVAPRLKLISINTQYCDMYNFWLYVNTTDPDGVLQWLADELQDAEDNGDFVHIIGHIPTGETGWCIKWWSANYYDIVNRYKNTIRGQFFGHTHKDSFQMFYEDGDYTKTPTSVLYVAPSFTTFDTHNSAYRSYDLSRLTSDSATSYVVTDHTTYIFNPDLIGAETSPVWQKEYSAKEYYGLQSLQPIEWNKLLKSMMDGSTEAYQVLMDYVSFHHTNTTYPCNNQCLQKLLCTIRQGRSRDVSLCSDIYRLPPFVSPTTTEAVVFTTNTPDPYCWYCLTGGAQKNNYFANGVLIVLVSTYLLW